MPLSPSLLRRIRLCGLLLMLAVLVAEVVLQLLCGMSPMFNAYMSPLAPADDVSVQVAHPVLQRAPNPEFLDHDFEGIAMLGYRHNSISWR